MKIKFKMVTFLLLLVLLLALITTAPLKKQDDNYAEQDVEVSVWQTTGDKKDLLEKKESLYLSNSDSSPPLSITIDPNTAYQEMDGFGAAVTGSSAYLFQNMNTADRTSMYEDLFTSKGINLSTIRHTIGASDFSVDENGYPSSYTYDDTKEAIDYSLKDFSIEKDRKVIKSLQEILAVKQDMKIIGTPWTAPAWMKFGEKTLNGWYLDYTNDKVYEAYADYFVRYIQAYQNNGFNISSITLQNEPEFTSENYPSMSMGAEEQARFIGQYLGPAFQAHNIKTKIIGYDHNWHGAGDYINSLSQTDIATDYLDGFAFHCYEGEPAAMSQVHESYPTKQIYLTECSSGKWSESFADNFSWQMSNLIIGGPRNWAKSVLMWNIALDENNGPTNGGCNNCTGLLTIDQATGNIEKNAEYYALGHASKFVQAEAARIYSTNFPGALETVAYQNPDKSIVLIALNQSNEKKSFQVNFEGKFFTYSIPNKSAVTFSWDI